MRAIRGLTRRCRGVLLLSSLTIFPTACGPGVNLTQGLAVDAASTGWLEVRRDKVVPALKLALRNTSQERLRVLLVNARFHSTDNADEWGTGFLTAVGSDGLAPGAATGTIVLKGEFGYTGSGVQRMVDQFVDTKVELFAKYGAERWTRLGEFTIARQLLQ